MSEWQPIETAPKDGTEVLIYSKNYTISASWDEDSQEWMNGFLGIGLDRFEVIYWRPMLPTHNPEKEE